MVSSGSRVYDGELLDALLDVVELMDDDESIAPIKGSDEGTPELTDEMLEGARRRVYARLGIRDGLDGKTSPKDESSAVEEDRAVRVFRNRKFYLHEVFSVGDLDGMQNIGAAPTAWIAPVIQIADHPPTGSFGHAYKALPSWRALHQIGRAEGAAGKTAAAYSQGSTTGPRPRVSVVMMAYAGGSQLPALLKSMPQDLHQLVIVGAHSVDVENAPKWLSPQLVWKPFSTSGSMLNSGFQSATGDVIVVMSADGSMDPRQIPTLVDALIDGADFAKGARSHVVHRSPRQGTGLRERLLTKLGNHYWGTKYADLPYGYAAFWDHCLPDFTSYDSCSASTGTASYDLLRQGVFLNLRAAWKSYRVEEVQLTESIEFNSPSLGRRDLVRFLLDLVAAKRSGMEGDMCRPHRAQDEPVPPEARLPARCEDPRRLSS